MDRKDFYSVYRYGELVCSSKFLVYGLVDPRTDIVRYIGMSTQGLRRPRRHTSKTAIATKSNPGKLAWILELKDLGLAPEIRILQECKSVGEAADTERALIADYRKRGVALTNMSEGGKASSLGARYALAKPRVVGARKGERRSAETRARMSAAKKEWWKNPSADALARIRELGLRRKGKKDSEETLRKRSASKKAAWAATTEVSPKIIVHARKMAEQRKGKPLPEETKRKLSEARKAWWSENHQAKAARLKEAAKGRRVPEETKRRIAAAMKTWWETHAGEQKARLEQMREHMRKLGRQSKGRIASEEARRRMSEAKKAWWARKAAEFDAWWAARKAREAEAK
jgi:NUMOD3 motif-containing protein